MTTMPKGAPKTGAGGDTYFLNQISDAEFRRFRDLVYARFGITLSDEKKGLVVSRFGKTLKQRGIHSYAEYCDHLEKDTTGRSLSEFVDTITTNYTYFYREKAHFDFLMSRAFGEVKRREAARGRKEIRLWCAGCATGEESYMLQILMMEYFGADYGQWDAGVLATDISDRALTIARAGVYPEAQFQHMPAALLKKYFTRTKEGDYAVNESVKKEVTFRRFNLMNEKFPFKKPFDLVFCRNVMIYFDEKTRENLARRFHNATYPQGFLFIGHSESLRAANTGYRYVMPALYQRD